MYFMSESCYITNKYIDHINYYFFSPDKYPILILFSNMLKTKTSKMLLNYMYSVSIAPPPLKNRGNNMFLFTGKCNRFLKCPPSFSTQACECLIMLSKTCYNTPNHCNDHYKIVTSFGLFKFRVAHTIH